MTLGIVFSAVDEFFVALPAVTWTFLAVIIAGLVCGLFATKRKRHAAVTARVALLALRDRGEVSVTPPTPSAPCPEQVHQTGPSDLSVVEGPAGVALQG